MQKTFNNILVIQTAFIGDAILASSVIEKLHAFYPHASVSLLVRKGNESLYTRHPFLKEVLVWNKQGRKYASLFELRKKIKSDNYDAIINLHRYASSGFLTVFSGAGYKAGFDKNPFSFLFTKKVKHIIGDGRHEIDRYNELIADITDNNICKPKLYPTQFDLEKVTEYKKEKYVTMSPSSVWFTKQLPEDKWIELINQLPNDVTVYLLGGKGDLEACDRIKTKDKRSKTQVLAGELNLLQSAALMKDAQMNYVNDSAPLHLASSQNAPVTAFFCSTVPDFGFTPLSDNSRIMEVKNLDCRPCGLHGFKTCPKGHFKCGNEMNITGI